MNDPKRESIPVDPVAIKASKAEPDMVELKAGWGPVPWFWITLIILILSITVYKTLTLFHPPIG